MPRPTARSRKSPKTASAQAARNTEFDIIVFATGFDAMTGPLKALNLKGRGGRTLDRGVGGRSAHLSWRLGRRLPQPVHHHRPAKPVGAVEHAGIDRAARRMDHRLHRQHAQDRQDHHRGDAGGAGAMGRPCQRDRQHDADDQRQLLVHERQHPRQAARLLAVSGPGGVGGYRKKCDEVAAKGYEGFELA